MDAGQGRVDLNSRSQREVVRCSRIGLIRSLTGAPDGSRHSRQGAARDLLVGERRSGTAFPDQPVGRFPGYLGQDGPAVAGNGHSAQLAAGAMSAAHVSASISASGNATDTNSKSESTSTSHNYNY